MTVKTIKALILAFACIFPLAVQAASQEDISLPGCDVDIYNIHINRNLLEAHREVAMNQRYILKPDSVLEYTCFVSGSNATSILGTTADRAGPIFSESDLWDPKTIPLRTRAGSGTAQVNYSRGADSLDLALAAVVAVDTLNYLDENFGHEYLGGTYIDIPPSKPCRIMAQVWQAAKCNNFINEWYSFENLLTFDPREEPEECNGIGITQAMIDSIRSGNTAVQEFSIPRNIFTEFLVPPYECPPSTVYTGVTNHVIFAPGKQGVIETYSDGYCLSPGCVYLRDGDSGVCR